MKKKRNSVQKEKIKKSDRKNRQRIVAAKPETGL